MGGVEVRVTVGGGVVVGDVLEILLWLKYAVDAFSSSSRTHNVQKWVNVSQHSPNC